MHADGSITDRKAEGSIDFRKRVVTGPFSHRPALLTGLVTVQVRDTVEKANLVGRLALDEGDTRIGEDYRNVAPAGEPEELLGE